MATIVATPAPPQPIKGKVYLLANPPGGSGGAPPTTGRIWPR